MTTSITEQIRCAKRELAMRERIYPSWVRKDRLGATEAAREIEAMRAILTTLQHVRVLVEAQPKEVHDGHPNDYG